MIRQVKKKSPLPILLNISLFCTCFVVCCGLFCCWLVVFFPPILFKGDVDGKDLFKNLLYKLGSRVASNLTAQ